MAKPYSSGGFHISRPGALTARAKRHGKSVHAEAEQDAKSDNPTIKKQGVFALNAEHKFKPRKTGKKPAAKRVRARTSKKRAARKRG